MEELKALLSQELSDSLSQIVISNKRNKGGVNKIHIRPILLRGEILFQFASYTDKQVFHENLSKEDAINKIVELMEEYKQLELRSSNLSAVFLVSKKGKTVLNVKKNKANIATKGDNEEKLSHNRKKKYLLDPEIAVPFLMDLGIQGKDGKIKNTMNDKFKQINRYLEFVDDIVENLPKDREIVIIDFGCGKSYLTFAMYYYLHELKKLDIKMIGLDLKEDVINKCNELRTSYGYTKLDFFAGDIKDYDGVNHVDMVVTLHACDTATDYALEKAISWGAEVIMCVPCCQHEMNIQLKKNGVKNELSSLMSYGLIRERVAALMTDAIRAEILKDMGYDVSILEFIDMEHTPKNILIRATKVKHKKIEIKNKEYDYKTAMEYLGVTPLLDRLVKGE